MQILLRKVEGANVAIVRNDDGSAPELLPTRFDLFNYRGGIAWGYKGSGVRNLAYAIAARLLEGNRSLNIGEVVDCLIDELLSKLDGNQDHDINEDELIKLIEL
jgi:hypothetical protein